LWLLQRGALSRRLVAIAAVWTISLLAIGGFALDRMLSQGLTSAFDRDLTRSLNAMIASAEVMDSGEIRFIRALGDQRFFEPYSGYYWQVSSKGIRPFRSRSLWDRAITTDLGHPVFAIQRRDVRLFGVEDARLAERDAVLPGSEAIYRFIIAARTADLQDQIAGYRRVLAWSLGGLGGVLLILSAFQVTYGLWPLRRVREGLRRVRTGEVPRLDEDYPPEIQPLVSEMNALLAHNEEQAETARTHAGNLAHALKTPMAVLMNEARATPGPLGQSMTHQLALMKRHIDHHLARARAMGRRAYGGARTQVWQSLETFKRTLERIYAEKQVGIDLMGDRDTLFRGERQELEEIIGNLVDNACKYGRGSVRVTIAPAAPRDGDPYFSLTVEDDGDGIPQDLRDRLFARGARIDESIPGAGLGLAIVRDIAELGGGEVRMEQSRALGGLSVHVVLPAVEHG